MPVETIQRTLLVQGHRITYFLEQKEVKNLNLRIRKDGCVYVSANPSVPMEDIDAFIIRRGDYVLRSVAQFEEMKAYAPQPKQYVSGETFYILGRSLRLKVLQGAKNSLTTDGIYLFLQVKDTEDYKTKRRIISKYLDGQCLQIFQAELDHLYPLFQKYDVAKPQLRIRDMDTQWGSCLAKKGIITLNKRLLEAPQNCIEYVVMHELCHLIHPNHSKRFYQFLTMMMPDWKQRKIALDKNAAYWL